jgi:hypothetical protein
MSVNRVDVARDQVGQQLEGPRSPACRPIDRSKSLGEAVEQGLDIVGRRAVDVRSVSTRSSWPGPRHPGRAPPARRRAARAASRRSKADQDRRSPRGPRPPRPRLRPAIGVEVQGDLGRHALEGGVGGGAGPGQPRVVGQLARARPPSKVSAAREIAGQIQGLARHTRQTGSASGEAEARRSGSTASEKRRSDHQVQAQAEQRLVVVGAHAPGRRGSRPRRLPAGLRRRPHRTRTCLLRPGCPSAFLPCRRLAELRIDNRRKLHAGHHAAVQQFRTSGQTQLDQRRHHRRGRGAGGADQVVARDGRGREQGGDALAQGVVVDVRSGSAS